MEPQHSRVLAIRFILTLIGLPALAAGHPYPPLFDSPEIFRKNIAAAEASTRPLPQHITGVTVPHHLLAADLIANTLYQASGRQPARIIILTPDHYHRGTTPGSTTTRGFLSSMGPLAVDEAAARGLAARPGFSQSDLFSHEHGVQALLPFVARWFPGVPVLPVALGARSRPADWRQLADALRPYVTADTLVIQSTDFSHYLAQPVAAAKDQETLRLFTAADPARLTDLNQPDHLDSKAAQWLQMTLQREVFKVSGPLVADNRNAIRYGGRPNEPRTTSYITQFYAPEFIPASMLPGDAWFFGGDTHFGRHLAKLFADPARAARLRDKILAVTHSRPLIVNLEGVLLDDMPATYQHPMRIGMKTADTLAQLKRLGVTAVSVANNHSLDYGISNRETMIRLLTENGIVALDAGKPAAAGPFLLGAATDVANLPQPANGLLKESSFDDWRIPASNKPLFAFLHCGVEYASAPGPRECQLAGWAENAGASLVIGCHPHRPSPGWIHSPKSLRFLSMGNLIFDQLDPANSGGLIEVRFFEQGTWFARWIPLGNAYRSSATSP
jgi:AmmeMemoRadiSam system protein B